MQRSSASARQFYCRFYQWATQGSLSHPRLHHQRSAFRSITRAHRVVASRHDVVLQKRYIETAAGETTAQKPAEAPTDLEYFTHLERTSDLTLEGKPEERAEPPIPPEWVSGPIQTRNERSSESIAAGEQVVRHRSDAGIVLETAIPESMIKGLEQAYGPQLQTFRGKHGTNVVLGSVVTIPPRGVFPVRSLTLSGSFRGCIRALHAISDPYLALVTRPPLETQTVAPNAFCRIRFTADSPIGQKRITALLSQDWARLYRMDFQLLGPEDGVFVLRGPPDIVGTVEYRLRAMITDFCAERSIVVNLEAELGILHADGTTTWTPRQFSNFAPKLRSDTLSTFRTLTHPVVVITAPGGNEKQGGEEGAGVTVSSFNTVAIAPRPYVSFNLKVDSRAWKAIQKGGQFRVHVLRNTPQGAAIASEFTRKEKSLRTVAELLRNTGFVISRPHEAPAIIHFGVSSRLLCRVDLDKCVVVGDHVLVIGMVLTASRRSPEAWDKEKALAYGLRTYRDLGEEIAPLLDGVIRPPEIETPQDDLSYATKRYVDSITLTEAERVYAQEADTQFSSSTDWSPSQTGVPPLRSMSLPQKMPGNSRGFHTSAHRLLYEDKSDKPRTNKQGSAARLEPLQPRNTESGEDHDRENDPDAWTEENREEEEEERAYLSQRFAEEEAEDEHEKELDPKQEGDLKEQLEYFENRYPFKAPVDGRVIEALPRDPNRKGPAPEDCVSDPRILQTPIGEFLGIPAGKHFAGNPQRLGGPAKLQQKVYHAGKRIKMFMKQGDLTPEQSLQLENDAIQAEKVFKKTLALRSAKDLDLMLDGGKVYVRLAQWLEQSVEQGMALLLEDTHILKQDYENGLTSDEEFKAKSELLRTSYARLEDVTTRLRSMAEDEDDSGAS